MHCPRCGHANPPNVSFCENCGANIDGSSAGPSKSSGPNPLASSPSAFPSAAPAASYPVRSSRYSGLAIAGFVLAFFCGLLGLILSIYGYQESRDDPYVDGEGLAMAGIIISSIHILFGLLFVVVPTCAAL